MNLNQIIIREVMFATLAEFDEVLPPDTVRLPIRVRFTLNNGRGNQKRFVRRNTVTGDLTFICGGQTYELLGMWRHKVDAMCPGMANAKPIGPV
jgi:hypothetical protein